MESERIESSHQHGPRELCDLEGALAEKNAILRELGHEELLHEEMIGGRLYTGPMYQKYNIVLRAAIDGPKMKKDFETSCKGNRYDDDPRAKLRRGQVLEAH